MYLYLNSLLCDLLLMHTDQPVGVKVSWKDASANVSWSSPNSEITHFVVAVENDEDAPTTMTVTGHSAVFSSLSLDCQGYTFFVTSAVSIKGSIITGATANISSAAVACQGQEPFPF